MYKGVSNRELGRHDLNGRYLPLGKHARDEDFSGHELSTSRDRYESASEEVVICHDYDMNGRDMTQYAHADYEVGGKNVCRRNTIDEEVIQLAPFKCNIEYFCMSINSQLASRKCCLF